MSENGIIKVAGVTFSNDDDESRQKILKNIGIGSNTADLKQISFRGERAVEVWIEGKLVGYIPKTELNNTLSYCSKLAALVLYFKKGSTGIYYVELSELKD